MRNHGRFLLRGAPALCSLLLASGCFLPGNFGVSSEPTASANKKIVGAPHTLIGPVASSNTTGPVSGPGPAPILPLNLAGPESPNDLISLQAQKLNDADQEHHLLAARLADLELMLQDRDKSLAEATDEIRKASEDINRKLLDVKRYKQDNADLLERLRKSEQEVIDLRKQLIKMMEKEEPPGGPPIEPDPGKQP
ncbi:MAG TPA: hypothetical protein VKA46_36050 [Gemmataceae bacterium]|nr:hypothetical protein [Gemmataceae bacterium]